MEIPVNEIISDLIQELEENPRAELGFYNELAPLYEHLYGQEYDYTGQADIVAENLDSKPSKILDVGCGTGHLMARMKGKFPGAEVEGIDLHEEMLDLASKRFEGDRGLEIRQQDFFEMEEAGKYDVITAFGVNPHFTEQQHEEFFEKASKLLTDDGILVFDYKDPEYEVNGRYSPWENETDQYDITAHFITLYENGDSNYVISYEFTEKETGEKHYTGMRVPVSFHNPERLRNQFSESGLTEVSHYTEDLDQSGCFVLSKTS